MQLVNGSYEARLLEVALHLESVLALDIPNTHPFAHPVRVEDLVADLEVRAPDRRGWLHKTMKMVSHKLAKKLGVADQMFKNIAL